MLLLLWRFGCTWREGRVDTALDSRRVDIVVDDKELWAVRALRNCHVVVCVSQLPLSDRVPVAAVVFQLRLEGRTCWQ